MNKFGGKSIIKYGICQAGKFVTKYVALMFNVNVWGNFVTKYVALMFNVNILGELLCVVFGLSENRNDLVGLWLIFNYSVSNMSYRKYLVT